MDIHRVRTLKKRRLPAYGHAERRVAAARPKCHAGMSAAPGAVVMLTHRHMRCAANDAPQRTATVPRQYLVAGKRACFARGCDGTNVAHENMFLRRRQPGQAVRARVSAVCARRRRRDTTSSRREHEPTTAIIAGQQKLNACSAGHKRPPTPLLSSIRRYAMNRPR